MAQFVVDPDASVCPITYSCAVIGPRNDICSILGVANFDPATGNYDFTTFDMATYPAGDYTFTITGTVGAKSVSETFVMTLVDPCPTTALTINNPASFVDGDYILRSSAIDRTWDIDVILSRATLVDCGPVTVEFFIDGTLAPLDATIFDDNRATPGAYSLQSLYTEDVTKKGPYPIMYNAFHTSYVTNVVTSA